MDVALPVPISRHFYREYSKVNPNVIYIEFPRTGHTATSKFIFVQHRDFNDKI